MAIARFPLMTGGALALLLAMGLPAPAMAGLQVTDTPLTIADAVARLKPGEYIWTPQVSPAGPVMIVVSLARQRAYVYRNGVIIGVSTASTGTPANATPTGVFTILQKEVDHVSNLYDDAPMPFMQRLTWGGVALHAGKIPGYPASHGCIRLPTAFARLLYGVTTRGMTVIITDRVAVPRVAPAVDLFAAGGAEIAAPTAPEWQWLDSIAASGPVSVVVSAADQRLLVLRNGKPIGSAPIVLRRPVDRTTAYTMAAADGGTPKWSRVALPWDGAADAPPTEGDDRDPVILDERFRQALVKILAPGTTVVVTADTLQSGSAGEALAVLSSE
ncbi:L,D-transpeptidase [Sphingomonas qomolangmaensis]|uniref:L,D-transpeptidase n=1 Tax=Sphingomonas qomolangmaensis TaxID=2918765 RepID=A0ABY5LBD5_9SPHN|nr:L,D-transpeptidase [Sphingomonas qomolangmaensis]UUL83436.1 L,D-transpeptidase [Sphingomonas qomolangmaensis]